MATQKSCSYHVFFSTWSCPIIYSLNMNNLFFNKIVCHLALPHTTICWGSNNSKLIRLYLQGTPRAQLHRFIILVESLIEVPLIHKR